MTGSTTDMSLTTPCGLQQTKRDKIPKEIKKGDEGEHALKLKSRRKREKKKKKKRIGRKKDSCQMLLHLVIANEDAH